MKRKFILAGVMLFLTASMSLATINIAAYQVDGYNSDNLEVGSTFRVSVSFHNDFGATTIIGTKFFINYDTALLNPIGESNYSDSLASYLPTRTTYSFGTPGEIRVSTNAEGGTGRATTQGEDVPLFTITFRVKQVDTNAGSKAILWWLPAIGDNVKLIKAGGDNITGTVNPFQAAILKVSAAPNSFTGISNVANPGTGNTLNLGWPNTGGDLNDGAATYYEGHTGSHSDGKGLRYNIYRGTTTPPPETNPITTINPLAGPGFAYTDTSLDDGQIYYYRVRAMDACLLNPNEEKNATILSKIPTDHTPPSAPTNLVAGSGNQQVNLSWAAGSGDTGGYLVIRYLTQPAANPVLKSAADNDPGNLGLASGDNYPVGTELGGGKVIYNGATAGCTDSGSDLTETHLINGRVYYYKVIAYDPVVTTHPVQQGRNYSAPANTSGIPGIAPDPIQNFYAISRANQNEITLIWDNSPNYATKPQGGTVIWYTTNIDKWKSIPEIPADWSNATKMQGISLLTVQPRTNASKTHEVITLSQDTAGTAFSTRETYFFKAFAYNKTGTNPTAADLKDSTKVKQWQFSSGVMAAAAPTVGGTGGGAGGPVTITLTKISGGMGVNSVGIPADAPLFFDDLAGHTYTLNTLQDLIGAVNGAAGAGTVTASAYWDGAKQQLTGASYSTTGSKTYSTPGFDESKINLVGGKGYYLSVSRNITFKLSPVR